MGKINFSIELQIESLNHVGYGVGHADGREYWVSNALPGETVQAQIGKKKKRVFMGVATEVTVASEYRIEEREEHFTASSPLQIATAEFESQWKNDFIRKTFETKADVTLDPFEVYTDGVQYGYRNKIEYGFYSDDSGMRYSFFKRDTRSGKWPHLGSLLAHENMNQAGLKVLELLNKNEMSARDFKSVIYRYSVSEEKVFGEVFVKNDEILDKLKTIDFGAIKELAGFRVVFSDPKSPASVHTDIVTSYGESEIVEQVAGVSLTYPLHGFFQVNPVAFSQTMDDMKEVLTNNIKGLKSLTMVDMYSGVGTIGLCLAGLMEKVIGVELFGDAKKYSELNAENNNIKNTQFIEASAENSLVQIAKADVLVLDPPRAGLNPKVIKQILNSNPKWLVYLSCNPVTQSDDWNKLKEKYDIIWNRAYNYYPRTPHVEHLIIAKKK